MTRQSWNLMPPGVPEFREAMQQNHQIPFSLSDVMETNVIGFNEAMLPYRGGRSHK
jgi:hypothetical protein